IQECSSGGGHMKKAPFCFGLILLLLYAVPFCAVAHADVEEAARLFDEGNASYREGNFDDARTAYEAVLSMGFESAALYQNLGNAYFRLDRLGQAMLNYQRAARLRPANPEIRHNIRLVQTRSRDRFSQVPTPVLARWWNGFIDGFGMRTLFWIGAISWLAGTILAGYRLWTSASGPWSRRVITLLCATGLFLLAGALATSAVRSNIAAGVVVSDRVEVRDEPEGGSRSAVVVHEALVIDILKVEEGWAEIRLPNGITGYVPEEAVAAV
ncbi:MAG: tetratricopeptide repeat protein, partial [Rhodothermia bacterium]|nr:tetratricopeptide repeat protein [Rhodothermia bacterium]